MSYNERIFNIITESAKSTKECCSKIECMDACTSFDITISDAESHFEKTVPANAVKCPKDAVPVCKGEACEDECGNMCESYYMDARFLDIYMEDNGIEDMGEAVEGLCEYYNIDVKDAVVLFECDEVNKGILDHAKEHRDIGLLKKYTCAIANCINHGIRVAKKSH